MYEWVNNTYTLVESKKTKNLQNTKEQLFRYRYLSDFSLLEHDGQSFSGNGVYTIVDDIQWKINPPGGVRPILFSEINEDFIQQLSQK